MTGSGDTPGGRICGTLSGMGHVFVVPGDITRFACDAWLLPSDRTLNVERPWLDTVDGLAGAMRAAERDPASRDLREENTLAFALPCRDDRPTPVLTAVPFHGVRSPADVEERVTAGLAEAARVARRRTGPRGRPLVATPLFGTAAGGGDAVRGTLVRAVLEAARRAPVDVALVLRTPRDLAHAQRIRCGEIDRWWPELEGDLRTTSLRLAEEARRGRLVPFIGAGVSMSAGLPSWTGLVDRLLGDHPEPVDRREFGGLDILDQAEILERRHDDRAAFAAAVVRHTTATRYGVAPALLSGLPCREAVTLNYDELYEMAGDALGRRTAILPGESAEAGQRWLLKLHGTVRDPASIVLTRRDYLDFRSGRDALAALAKAVFLTRHLLFVGFGLTDDHFHEVVHDVRAVRRSGGHGPKLGTALMLSTSDLQRRLWGADLDLVPLDGGGVHTRVEDRARRMEMFLDHLLAHSDTGLGHVLDPRFHAVLTPAEQRVASLLTELAGSFGPDEWSTPAGTAVGELLGRLGHDTRR